MDKNRYKVKLNSIQKVEELLQETYDQSCKQITEIQNEINKLTNSTDLSESSNDEKAKYAKAMHDYIGDKTKAIAQKFEIAKFMGETLKNNGDPSKVSGESVFSKSTSMDLGSLRKLKDLKEMVSEEKSEKYTLKGE